MSTTYKLIGKDRELKKTAHPVCFAEITFNEIKDVKQRPSRYSNITVEVPCPNHPTTVHPMPLTQVKKYRYESELRIAAHGALTPDWANPNHQPVSAPKKYEFSFHTDENEIVYITKNPWKSLLFLTIPARGIQKVEVEKIGFKRKYMTYKIDDKIVIIKAPPQLQMWLAANTEPETPVIDPKQEEMIRHGGGRRLCLTGYGGNRIVNAFPRYYNPNHPTPTHRYVSHIITEYLTDYLDNGSPTVQKIKKEFYAREMGSCEGWSLLKITPEEMNQMIQEHQQMGHDIA